MSEDQACEVPLVDQLRSIPEGYRTVRAIQWSDDGRETGHQYIPVGVMMHRAAAEIERLQSARPEALRNEIIEECAMVALQCRVLVDDEFDSLVETVRDAAGQLCDQIRALKTTPSPLARSQGKADG